jgi:hypothetical protein
MVWAAFSAAPALIIREVTFSDADFVLARRRFASQVARPKPASLNADGYEPSFACGALAFAEWGGS